MIDGSTADPDQNLVGSHGRLRHIFEHQRPSVLEQPDGSEASRVIQSGLDLHLRCCGIQPGADATTRSISGPYRAVVSLRSAKVARAARESTATPKETAGKKRTAGRKPPTRTLIFSSVLGHGEVEIATRFPLLGHPDRNGIAKSSAALH